MSELHASSIAWASLRHFSETPKQFLLRNRLSMAPHFLRSGWPLTAAWQEAGFASRPERTRQFRLTCALPPTAWLTQQGGANLRNLGLDE